MFHYNALSSKSDHDADISWMTCGVNGKVMVPSEEPPCD